MRIAIIPARGGSKRIPRKNIITFHGKPMIGHVIDELKASALFDVIHVSTDDEEIFKVAKSFGASVPFLRDSSLATDQVPVLSVVKWVAKEYQLQQGMCFNTYLMVTPCSPLLDKTDFLNSCTAFEKSDRKYPMLAVSRYPSPIEWAFHEKRGILSAANPENLLIRSQDLLPAYYDAGLFAYFNGAHLINEKKVESNFIKFELPRWKAIDIDEPEDLEVARKMMSLKYV